MKDAKTIGRILLIAGALLLVVSLLADVVGIGQESFGPKQIGGSIAGLVLAGVGYWLTRKP